LKIRRPLQYRGVLDVGTSDGKQPNVAPSTVISFPKQIVENGRKFPTCDPKTLDGQASVPAKCKKAEVGSGSAIAFPGTPGQPSISALQEALTVKAYNGKGHTLLLALNGSSPQTIQNRVITGKIGHGGGKFGYTVNFIVPQDLQFQAGFQVALTHFDVTIKAKTIKVKGKKVPYLGLTSCCCRLNYGWLLHGGWLWIVDGARRSASEGGVGHAWRKLRAASFFSLGN
jgi:hypothetical protein